MKNILILNAGTRNKLTKDFKKDLDNGKQRRESIDETILSYALFIGE